MASHNKNFAKRLNRKTFDIRSSEFDSSKQRVNTLMDGRKFGDEVDPDYAWFLNFLEETNELTKSSMEEIIEDEDDKDPQYCMFLKALTENGKFYKLKVSKNGESPSFIKYHEEEGYDPPIYLNIDGDNGGDKGVSSEATREINQKLEDLLNKRSLERKKKKISMAEEGSRKRKIDKHNIESDSCYRVFLDGCVNSEYGSFVYDGKQVKYEEVMPSDSDVLIWDNVQGCEEVNNNHCVNAEKDSSLKQKMMGILRQPYNQEEYEELLEYVSQEKPVCRLLPLRDRAISSAMEGWTKSVLDDVPPSFKTKLDAVRDVPPKALNLLRGIRFWLEHLPNKGSFKPWLDEDCLKVLPPSSTR